MDKEKKILLMNFKMYKHQLNKYKLKLRKFERPGYLEKYRNEDITLLQSILTEIGNDIDSLKNTMQKIYNLMHSNNFSLESSDFRILQIKFHTQKKHILEKFDKYDEVENDPNNKNVNVENPLEEAGVAEALRMAKGNANRAGANAHKATIEARHAMNNINAMAAKLSEPWNSSPKAREARKAAREARKAARDAHKPANEFIIKNPLRSANVREAPVVNTKKCSGWGCLGFGGGTRRLKKRSHKRGTRKARS